MVTEDGGKKLDRWEDLNWELRSNRYTLLMYKIYEQLSPTVYSRNYILYLIITYSKESKRKKKN